MPSVDYEPTRPALRRLPLFVTVGAAAARSAARTEAIERTTDRMALDGTVLGNCAQEQMEALDDAYGDDETAEIGAVLTIVQVLKRIDGAEGEDYSSTVRIRHNIPDPYAAIGYLRAAEQSIVQQISGGEEE
jgi:hypothetical protein